MAEATSQIQKSYFDVLGICCSSEIPLVENIVNALPGVKECSVLVTTRTVIVSHDTLLVSQLQIVKALNKARLEANVRVIGSQGDHKKKWPTPYSICSGILLIVSLFGHLYHPLRWIALGAVAAGIPPILLKGIAAVRKLRVDITIIAIIAVIGTIVLGDYIEAATIVFLFSIAEWLEQRAAHKAQAVMSSLLSIAPRKAVIADSGEEVDVDNVKLNTILAVKAGETIPIDGTVVDGKCEVDEKTLTGESFPVTKELGDTAFAGTINLDGYIKVKTTAMASDCVVAKMTKLVEEAQSSKTDTQRLIDRCAMYYTPAVILVSSCIAFVPLIFHHVNRGYWIHLALVVLVSACPCSLILSTPVATFCALTRAATAGILFKGAEHLETLAKTKVMAFDKTGTLTRGEFTIDKFEVLSDEFTRETLLYWVASIESKSGHPMAAALVDHSQSFSVGASPENVLDFLNYPGEGIHGKIDGRNVYVGNRKLAARASADIDSLKFNGRTIGFVYCDGKAVAVFSMSDRCRTGVKEALNGLRRLKIKTCMLTGDTLAAAMDAQQEMEYAVEEVRAELLPEDKARIIESYKREGITSMVGDGINDAPALATADIGVSMGISGSALATQTGQVILMSNDLRKLPKMIKLSRRASSKIIENIILSMGTKGAILGLALAGHPLVWAAVLADVGTCILVILNSMLLLGTPHHHSTKAKKLSTASSSSHHHFFCCNTRHLYHMVKNNSEEESCRRVLRSKSDCAEESCTRASRTKSCCEEESFRRVLRSKSCCEEESCRGSTKKKDCAEESCCIVPIKKDSAEKSCCRVPIKKNECTEESSCIVPINKGCAEKSCCRVPIKKNDCVEESSCIVSIKKDCAEKSCCRGPIKKNDCAEESSCIVSIKKDCAEKSCCRGPINKNDCAEESSCIVSINNDCGEKSSCIVSINNDCAEKSCCRGPIKKNDCAEESCCIVPINKDCAEKSCCRVSIKKNDCAEESSCIVPINNDCAEKSCCRVPIKKNDCAEEGCCIDLIKKNDCAEQSCCRVPIKKIDCAEEACCRVPIAEEACSIDPIKKKNCAEEYCCIDEGTKNECAEEGCCNMNRNCGGEMEKKHVGGCCETKDSHCGGEDGKTKCCQANNCCNGDLMQIVIQ